MNPLAFRAIALDLDGTLLDAQGKLPLRTARILRLLAGKGLQIVLASGRMTERVMPYAEQLGIPVTVVSYNGASIQEGDPSGWNALSFRSLPEPARDLVFNLCRSESVFMNVYAHGKVHGYHAKGDFTWSKHYETNSGAVYAGKHIRLEDLPRSDIAKLLVIATPIDREGLYEKWYPVLKDHCVITKSNPEYLEFLGQGVSKGTALKIWLDKKAILPSELLAFGDAENDLEMLKLAGTGIGMANATPGLRATHSHFSAWDHTQEGVARELAALFQISFA